MPIASSLVNLLFFSSKLSFSHTHAPNALPPPTTAHTAEVTLHLKTTGDNLRTIEVSVKSDYLGDIMKFGGHTTLKEEYGKYSPSYDADSQTVQISFDCDDLPEGPEEVITKVSLLKRKMYGAPFDQVFHSILNDESETLGPICFDYRKDGKMFLKPGDKQVAVIIQLNFSDATDVELAKILMTEFAEAQRKVNGAPSTKFYEGKAPPGALECAAAMGEKGVPNEKGAFFIQVIVTKPILKKSKESRDRIADLLIGLRTYLLYHMKCTKAYMLSRMRAKYHSLLQVLNRAKPLLKSEMGSKRREM